MRDSKLQIILSAAAAFCLLMTTTVVKAGPVRLSQVVQIVTSNPTTSGKTAATRLRVAPQDDPPAKGDNPPPTQPQVQDGVEGVVTEEGLCDCPDIPGTPVYAKGHFPYWVLGFAAIPIGFLIFRHKKCDRDDEQCDSTPTPTPTDSPTPTPTITPPMSPTPPTTVPEPMTLLLFGTGLTGLGAAVRRRMRKRLEQDKLVDEKSGDE